MPTSTTSTLRTSSLKSGPDIPVLDMRHVRGLLAEYRVPPAQFATLCGLSRPFCSTVLHEHRNAGRLTRLLMLRGLERLGIPAEEVHHVS